MPGMGMGMPGMGMGMPFMGMPGRLLAHEALFHSRIPQFRHAADAAAWLQRCMWLWAWLQDAVSDAHADESLRFLGGGWRGGTDGAEGRCLGKCLERCHRCP